MDPFFKGQKETPGSDPTSEALKFEGTNPVTQAVGPVRLSVAPGRSQRHVRGGGQAAGSG